MKTNPGIDYALGSTVNRNPETGIRYGIIPTNDLDSDALESVYQDGDDEDFLAWKDAISTAIRSAIEDYVGERAIAAAIDAALEEGSDGYEGTGDCTRYSYEKDGYKLQTDSSGDLWVFDSPYYTHAQYCSPCAPGAGYLRSPCDDGPKTYCLGHDWFNADNPCPYPVFRVSDGTKVEGV